LTADPALVAASAAFAGACAFGSAVAVREGIPGEPLGIALPITVRTGVVTGWGAGIAAPWPMPVAAVLTAATARRREPGVVQGRVCAAIGLGCIAGTLIEPVTWRPRSWSAAAGAAIGLNLAASAALIGAGLRDSAAARALQRRGEP
jgi:hypothetical protein